MATRNFSISLPEELIEKLDRLVEALHPKEPGKLTRNLLIRACIEDYIRSHNSLEREKIGEWMIRQGEMTEEQARQVLKKQQIDGNKRRFGEIAVEAGFISQATLENYLDERGKKT